MRVSYLKANGWTIQFVHANDNWWWIVATCVGVTTP